MKILKIFFTIFLLGFLLFGFLYIKSWIQYKADRAEWEAEVVELDKRIEEAQLERMRFEEEAEFWADRASEANVKVANREAELEAKRREHEVMLANIAIMPPDEVVSELVLILKLPETHVTLSGLGVTFSLDASRLVLTKLQAYEFSLKEEKPAYVDIIALMDVTIKSQKEEIQALRNTNRAWSKECDGLRLKYEGEHELRLKAEATPQFNLFTTKNVVIGLSVTAVVVGAFIIF